MFEERSKTLPAEGIVLEVGAEELYVAYGDSVEWRTFQDIPMNSWAELPEGIRLRWRAVAKVAVEHGFFPKDWR